MDKAHRLARRLLKQNRRKRAPRSWRAIAREDFNDQIDHSTLRKFVLDPDKGKPKDERLLIILGLKKPHKHNCKPKFISEMKECELIEALRNRQPMPEVDPRIIKAFRKLGWLQRTRVTA